MPSRPRTRAISAMRYMPMGMPPITEIMVFITVPKVQTKKYDAAIWAHHGMFCSGEDFDLTFGLMHTVEKSAGILVKTLSMTGAKRPGLPGRFCALIAFYQSS